MIKYVHYHHKRVQTINHLLDKKKKESKQQVLETI